MAKKKADDETEGKKKKKPIVPIVLVLLGLFGAKTFLLKPAAKTPAQIEAAKKEADQALYNLCAGANNKPTLADVADGQTPMPGDVTTTTTAAPGSSTSTTTQSSTTTKSGASSSRDGAPRHIAIQLVAFHAAGSGATPPIVAGMGQVLELDPVTVNLPGGHFLKLGLALQLAVGVDAATAKDQGLGAKALDMALTELSKHTMDQLLPATGRDQVKDDLGFATCQAYDGQVLTVYFTDFVMQ